MIVTVYSEMPQREGDSGHTLHYKEHDFNLANIVKFTWGFTNGKVESVEVVYVSGAGKTYRNPVAKKLYPKVRAWQRTLERAPVYAGGGEL